jgi:hypothetical protein
MTVQLPGGGVEEIRYTGDVPPQVRVEPVVAATAIPWIDPTPFAEFDRISAAMDRQAMLLLRQAALLNSPNANLVDTAALAQLPPGSREYTFFSTASGSGICTRSMEMTATGNRPPKVVTHSSGNCAPAGGAGSPVGLPATPAPSRSDLIMTKAQGAKPYAGLVREIPVALR